MKLSALQHVRRSNSFRASFLMDSPSDGSGKSRASFFWLVFHGLCCLISLILGFRFSRLIFFLLFSTTTTTLPYTSPFRPALDVAETLPVQSTLSSTSSPLNRTAVSSSRVVVGRHGISIRPWPHPNPVEVMKAHMIINKVQKEQRILNGVNNHRTVIAITPTYVRTFQTLHLTGVMHSLMNVPYDVIWIVVEAGGATNETASLLAKSSLRIIHIGYDDRMPILWEDRHSLESRMRVRALRFVRAQKLDGIVMFADDSNTHTMELFDEIQKVKSIGAVSVGILAIPGGAVDELASDKNGVDERNSSVPVQGPACDSSNKLIGWHTFNTLPFLEKRARIVGEKAVVLPRKLEWAGFVLNSRLVWEEPKDKPEWVKDFDTIAVAGDEENDIENPLSLLKDTSVVEPLGKCGLKVLLWWLRVEARADSKFPSRWIIDPPLEVNVHAKHTPWPDVSTELPSNEKSVRKVEETDKHSTKTRSPRSKRKSKRKQIDHLPVKHSEVNPLEK